MTRPAPRRQALPIRARLTLWYAAVLVVIVAGLGVAAIAELRTGLRDRAHESLEGPYRVIENQLRVAKGPTLRALLHEAPPADEARGEVIGQLLDGRARVVDSSGDAGATAPMVGPAVLAEASRTGQWHEPRRLPGRAHDDIVVVVPLRTGPHAGQYVALAQTLAPTDAQVHGLTRRLLVLAPIVLLAALLGGWRIAAAALRPVDELTRTAAAIDPAKSDALLPVPPRDDELGRLARTLNDMLARMRRTLEAERRFSADASHELRTPLGLMRAEVDVALRSAKTPPEARPVLESVGEEVTRLSRTVEDLLVLSRADAAGEVALALQQADLLDLAVGVVGRFRPAAADRDVALEVTGTACVATVDPALLTQAIGNLVDNAVKFSAGGGRVTVSVGNDGDPRISVADEGCGIPADELGHAFERFYRVDQARRRTTGGTGLGLAITRSIVDAHGGRIEVESRVGEGSRFTIHLRPDATRPTEPGGA